MKKTLVIGASVNPDRYAYKAVHRLRSYGHEVVAVGKREGMIDDVKIHTGMPVVNDLDTITLYINPSHQEEIQDYILSLHPKRIIFNPGTENPILEKMAAEKGIETEEACTLTLLSIGGF